MQSAKKKRGEKRRKGPRVYNKVLLKCGQTCGLQACETEIQLIGQTGPNVRDGPLFEIRFGVLRTFMTR